MNRTGWAAAVGSLYKTSGGHTIKITGYRASLGSHHVHEVVTGRSETHEAVYLYDTYGICTGTIELPADPLPDFDLISAVQPAQVTKIIKCKDDLATRPQEGTVPATVVPRRDLP